MIYALVLLPMAAGVAAWLLPWNRWRRLLLVGTAVAHLLLTIHAWQRRPAPVLHGWLALDAAGLIFLSIASVLFLASAVYTIGYLRRETQTHGGGTENPLLPATQPETVFTACLLFFLGTMCLVTVSQHFGLLWVAIEATTLASAPLIYFHRHDRSLEATWKYLLLCSVGIAVALLGNFFLAVSASAPGGEAISLKTGDLVRQARQLNGPWLKAAFLLLLAGYGTKMGLAPLHSWLPDAHSEAPSPVSALLSGALLNCAFLGILRGQQVCAAAGLAAFGRESLLALGLASMLVGAVFILRQPDYKRMLAYSSVEHMGILALGAGIGGAGLFGAFFHAVNHSLTKSALFQVSGNLLSAYGTKSTSQVRNILRVLPASGWLWLAGFLAIAGSPPFGSFWSKFLILKAAFDSGQWPAACAALLFLGVIFVSLSSLVLAMTQAEAPESAEPRPVRAETWIFTVPALVLLLLVLLLGFYLPPFLAQTLHSAAADIGG